MTLPARPEPPAEPMHELLLWAKEERAEWRDVNVDRYHQMNRVVNHLLDILTAPATIPSDTPPLAEDGARLRALVALATDLQRRAHDAAVASSPMFSVLHWKHNAGPDWPQEPDDDSYTAFENCVYPDCKLVRDAALTEGRR